MSRSRVLLRASALAAALGLAAVACVGCGGGQADKAGGSIGPVTLRLGTLDSPSHPTSDEVARFAARVEQLSGGNIKVKIVWQAMGSAMTRWDQRIAGMVRHGRLDAAMVLARAWDREGVSSLQALQAPFLITSQTLLNRVVTSPLADEMLSGLQKAGVTGLVLLPAQLLHPFGYGRALRGPQDFAGARIRVPFSNASYRLWRALGARPVDLYGDAEVAAVRKGKVDGSEWYLELGTFVPGVPDRWSATANVTFFAKINVLVVNSKAFDGVTDEQRAILRRAAAETLNYVLRTNVAEAKAAAQYCREGGTIVAASPGELAALERAVKPVYTALLAKDAQTKRLIERIQELKQQTAAAAPRPVAPCRSAKSSARPAPSAQAQTGPPIPNGIYRKNITQQQLIDAGVNKTDAYNNYGLDTLTIKDGHWRIDEKSARPQQGEPCDGTIDYSGARATFFTDCPSSTTTLVFSATWKLDEGELHFLDVKDASGRSNVFGDVLFGGRPWKKIG